MSFNLDSYLEEAFGDSTDPERALLRAFVHSTIKVIVEHSGSIMEDCKALRFWADNYAHEADFYPVDIDWSCYIIDDEP